MCFAGAQHSQWEDENSLASEHSCAFLHLSGEMSAKSQVQNSLAGCGPKFKKRGITVSKGKVTLDVWKKIGIIQFFGFGILLGFQKTLKDYTRSLQTLSWSGKPRCLFLNAQIHCQVESLSAALISNPILLFFHCADDPSRKVSTDWWRWYKSLARAQKSRKISRSRYRKTPSSSLKERRILVWLHCTRVLTQDPQDAKSARQEPGKSHSSRLSQNKPVLEGSCLIFFTQVRCKN